MGFVHKRAAQAQVPVCLLLLTCLGRSGTALGASEVVLYAAPVSQTAAPATSARLIGAACPPVTSLPLTVPLAAGMPPPEAPFGAAAELSAEALVGQVLARNPSLAQMVAAWQAARARYPQVTALEDPMFAGTIGPGTLAPDDPGINFAYRLELSQKYPWPGKRALRGQGALAEASAAGHEVEDMRLQLIESASSAFVDYYLVYRALEVNRENRELLQKFRRNARSRYENRLAPLQDVLQADVEIGRQRERELSLKRMRQVAIARINTLMHRVPDVPLPPPPRQLPVRDRLPGAPALRARALAHRPDLQALADRITADKAALALACKEFYPDFEPFAMYDRFMGNNEQSKDLAVMIGVRLNLPVRQARRNAAVAEAQARLAQRCAELARQTDQVNFQVQQAYEQVRESARTVRLYDRTILPAARENVEAAASAYEAGTIPFLSLIEAQRNLVGLRDRSYEAVADYFRRRATLERVSGGPLTP